MATRAARVYVLAMRAFLDRLRPYAPLTLRLMLGALAILFSMKKVMHGMPEFQKDVVTGWGQKPWVAPAVAWGSIVCGFLVLIGFATRLGALGLATITGLLIWKTKLHAGFAGGLDFPLLELAAAISVLLSGAGRPSVDDKLFPS